MQSEPSTSEQNYLDVQNSTSSALFAAQVVKYEPLIKNWRFGCNNYRGCKKDRDTILMEIAKILGLPQEEKFMVKYYMKFRRTYEGKLRRLIVQCIKRMIPPERALNLPKVPQWVRETEKYVSQLPRLIKTFRKPNTEDRKAEFVTKIVKIAHQANKIPKGPSSGMLRLARTFASTYTEVENMWLRIAEVATWRLENHMVMACSDEKQRRGIATMDAIDWEVVDLLILFGEIRDLVTDDSLSYPTIVAALKCLCSLVDRHEIEKPCRPETLRIRWNNLYKEYRKTHRLHSSILLLQRQWYEVKRNTASVIRARINDTSAASPHQLYIDVAAKFPHVVTQPQKSWSQMKEKQMVVKKIEGESEALEVEETNICECEALRVEQDNTEEQADDDVIILENEIETIDIWSDDSGKEHASDDDDDENRLVIDDNPPMAYDFDDRSTDDNEYHDNTTEDVERDITRLKTSHIETTADSNNAISSVKDEIPSETEVNDDVSLVSGADDKAASDSEVNLISESGVDSNSIRNLETDGVDADPRYPSLTISDDDDDEGVLVIDDQIELDKNKDLNRRETDNVSSTTITDSPAKIDNKSCVIKPKLNIVSPSQRNRYKISRYKSSAINKTKFSSELEKVHKLARISACKKLDDELENQLKLIVKHSRNSNNCEVKKVTERNLVTDSINYDTEQDEKFIYIENVRRSVRKTTTNKTTTVQAGEVSDQTPIDVLQLTPRCFNFDAGITPLELLQRIDPSRAQATVIFEDSDEDQVNTEDAKTIINVVDIEQDESQNVITMKIEIDDPTMDNEINSCEGNLDFDTNDRSVVSNDFENKQIIRNETVSSNDDFQNKCLQNNDNSENKPKSPDQSATENINEILKNNATSVESENNPIRNNVQLCSDTQRPNDTTRSNNDTLYDEHIVNGSKDTFAETEISNQITTCDDKVDYSLKQHQENSAVNATMKVNYNHNIENENVSPKDVVAENKCINSNIEVNECNIENRHDDNVIPNELNTNDEQIQNKVTDTHDTHRSLNTIGQTAQMKVDDNKNMEEVAEYDIDKHKEVNIIENELSTNDEQKQNNGDITNTLNEIDNCSKRQQILNNDTIDQNAQMEVDDNKNMEAENTSEIVKDPVSKNICIDTNVDVRKNIGQNLDDDVIESEFATIDEQKQDTVLSTDVVNSSQDIDKTMVCSETSLNADSNFNTVANDTIDTNSDRIENRSDAVDCCLNVGNKDIEKSIQANKTNNTNVEIEPSVTSIDEGKSITNNINKCDNTIIIKTIETCSIKDSTKVTQADSDVMIDDNQSKLIESTHFVNIEKTLNSNKCEGPSITDSKVSEIHKMEADITKSDESDINVTKNQPSSWDKALIVKENSKYNNELEGEIDTSSANVSNDKSVLDTEVTSNNSEKKRRDSFKNIDLNFCNLKDLLNKHDTNTFLDYLHNGNTSKNTDENVVHHDNSIDAINENNENVKDTADTIKPILAKKSTSSHAADDVHNDNLIDTVSDGINENCGNIEIITKTIKPVLVKKNIPSDVAEVNDSDNSDEVDITQNEKIATSINNVSNDKNDLDTEVTSNNSEKKRSDTFNTMDLNFCTLKDLLNRHNSDKFLDHLHKSSLSKNTDEINENSGNINDTAETIEPTLAKTNTVSHAAEVTDTDSSDDVDMSQNDRIDEESCISDSSNENSNSCENFEIDPKLLMTTQICLVRIDEPRNIYPKSRTKGIPVNILITSDHEEVVNNANNIGEMSESRKESTDSEYKPTESEPTDNESSDDNNKVDNNLSEDDEDELIYKTRRKIVKYMNSDESDVPSDDNEKTEYMPYKERKRQRKLLLEKEKMLKNARNNEILNKVDFNSNRNEDCNVPLEGNIENMLKYCMEVRVVLERVSSDGGQSFVRKVRLPDKSSLTKRPTAHVAPLTASSKSKDTLPTQDELEKLLQDLMKRNNLTTSRSKIQNSAPETNLNQNANTSTKAIQRTINSASSLRPPNPNAPRKLDHRQVNAQYVEELNTDLTGLFTKITPRSRKKTTRIGPKSQVPKEPEPEPSRESEDDNGYKEWIRQKNLTKRFFDFPQSLNTKKQKTNAGPKSKRSETITENIQTVAHQQISTSNITGMQNQKNLTEPIKMPIFVNKQLRGFVTEKTINIEKDTIRVVKLNPSSLLKTNIVAQNITVPNLNPEHLLVLAQNTDATDPNYIHKLHRPDIEKQQNISNKDEAVNRANKNIKKCTQVDIPIASSGNVVKQEKMPEIVAPLEDTLIGMKINMPKDIEAQKRKLDNKNSVAGSDDEVDSEVVPVKKLKTINKMQNTINKVNEDTSSINSNSYTNDILPSDNLNPIITNVMSLANTQVIKDHLPVPKIQKKMKKPVSKAVKTHTRLVSYFHGLAAKTNTLLDNTEATLSSTKAFLDSLLPGTSQLNSSTSISCTSLRLSNQNSKTRQIYNRTNNLDIGKRMLTTGTSKDNPVNKNNDFQFKSGWQPKNMTKSDTAGQLPSTTRLLGKQQLNIGSKPEENGQVRNTSKVVKEPSANRSTAELKRSTANTPKPELKRSNANTPNTNLRRPNAEVRRPNANTPNPELRRPTPNTPNAELRRPNANTPNVELRRPTANTPNPELRRPNANPPKMALKRPITNSPTLEPKEPVANTSKEELRSSSPNILNTKFEKQIANTAKADFKKPSPKTTTVEFKRPIMVVRRPKFKGRGSNTPRDLKGPTAQCIKNPISRQVADTATVQVENISKTNVDIHENTPIMPRIVFDTQDISTSPPVTVKEFLKHKDLTNIELIVVDAAKPLMKLPNDIIFLTDSNIYISAPTYWSVAPKNQSVMVLLKELGNADNLGPSIFANNDIFLDNKWYKKLSEDPFVYARIYYAISDGPVLIEKIGTQQQLLYTYSLTTGDIKPARLANPAAPSMAPSRVPINVNSTQNQNTANSFNIAIPNNTIMINTIPPNIAMNMGSNNTVANSVMTSNNTMTAPNYMMGPNNTMTNTMMAPNYMMGPNNTVSNSMLPPNNTMGPNDRIQPNIRFVQNTAAAFNNVSPNIIPLNNMNSNVIAPNMQLQTNVPMASGNNVLLPNNVMTNVTGHNTMFSNCVLVPSNVLAQNNVLPQNIHIKEDPDAASRVPVISLDSDEE